MLTLNNNSIINPIESKFSDSPKVNELETKKSLAQKLKYSISYINKLMRQRKIPYLKNGKSVRFILSEVMTALQEGSAL